MTMETKEYLGAFKKWFKNDKEWRFISWRYDEVSYLDEPLPRTQDEIQKFILTLESNYRKIPEDSGIFVSYCVNEVYPRKEIKIQVKKPFSYLGALTEKRWDIIGNVDRSTGEAMKGGEIIVEGDAGYGVGTEMESGKILIKGNVGEAVGDGMKGGEIIVEGDAGYCVGRDMKNGMVIINGNAKGNIGGRLGKEAKIYFNGKYGNIDDLCFNGEIYHKGKLVFKDGKKIK